MVVDQRADATSIKASDRLDQFRLVVGRIDPELLDVRSSEPSHLQSHERDLFNEWQVSGDEFAQFHEMRDRLSVQHDTELYPLTKVCEVQEASDRVVESSRRLHDVVVRGR